MSYYGGGGEFGAGMMNPNYGFMGMMNPFMGMMPGFMPGWNPYTSQGFGDYGDAWRQQMGQNMDWLQREQQSWLQQNPDMARLYGQQMGLAGMGNTMQGMGMQQQMGLMPMQGQLQGANLQNQLEMAQQFDPQNMYRQQYGWRGPSSDFTMRGPNDQVLLGVQQHPESSYVQLGDWGSLFGFGGPGGGGGWGQNPEMQPFQGGGYQAPDRWKGGSLEAPQSSYDASQMVQRMEPILQRQREQGFAQVGDRFGQSGFAMSTPYAQQLGDVERQLQENLAKEAWGWQAQLDQERANRDLAAQQNQFNRQLQAWGQHGGWQHGGQLAGMGQDLAAWQQQGNWQQQNANRDLAAWQAQMQNNLMGQQMMASLLPMFMGGIF